MYKVIENRKLNDSVYKLIVHAPHVAKRALAGQFVMLRVDETGERIPLTISDYDRESGNVTVVFQAIGATTQELSKLSENGYVLDFLGPLGTPSAIENIHRAIVIGGGVGVAIMYPIAKALFENGAHTTTIAGFRSKDLIFYKEEFENVSTKSFITTDDGSFGEKAFVTNVLQRILEEGERPELVIAIGPIRMMENVCKVTKPFGTKTVVSMNPLMIDGTGMCGCCRLTVGGQVKFACVDGPEFDGALVDFDEAIYRVGVYRAKELECMGKVER